MAQVVTFGEIMLRLMPPGFKRFVQARAFEATYGGGEANVAVSLANFGVEAEFVTRLPANELGDAAIFRLRQFGVHTDHIVRGGDRLGIYFLEAGAAQRGSKVIYDRDFSSFATIQPGSVNWENVLAGAEWFHWTGITPSVSEGAALACEEAIHAARQKGLTISCDLNHRAKLWKWGKSPNEVMSRLAQESDVMISNEEDADKVFGIHAPETDVNSGIVDAGKYRTVCEALAQKFPRLKTIAITLRGSMSASHNTWSAAIWHNQKYLVGPCYDILPVVDRVGSGDAFMAGLIFGFLKNPEDPDYALRFAVAASCLKHGIPGDFNVVGCEEVEQLMAGNGSGRVSR
jgi:2-dehydro-3-deoxygluconokinase